MENAWLDLLSYGGLNILVPLFVFLGTMAIGWVAKRVLLKIAQRWADQTVTRVDNILIEAMKGTVMFWVLILGLHLATQFSPLPDRLAALIGRSLLILLILSLTTVATRVTGKLVKVYGSQLQGALPVTSLTQNLARLGVVTVGAMIVLNQLGISITPILTALGVGGLAVALALQDTLSNLFAGLYVSLAGQIRPGDYVKLESGEEGFVTDINWRSTTVRLLANNLIIIPNAKLAQAIVTNYYLPEKRMSLLIPLSVSYDCDPDQIEELLLEETRGACAEVPGLLAEPEPFVRFIPGFGASSLDFTLICQVGEFTDQYLVQHELRKRIFKRFKQAGIEIPFPIRTVYLRDPAMNAPGRTVEAAG